MAQWATVLVAGLAIGGCGGDGGGGAKGGSGGSGGKGGSAGHGGAGGAGGSSAGCPAAGGPQLKFASPENCPRWLIVSFGSRMKSAVCGKAPLKMSRMLIVWTSYPVR